MNSGQSTNDTLVTTIIPSYNKHHYLKEALFSVLNQTHENMEILIINDFPSAQTRDELEDLSKLDKRIKVLHNKQNIGIANSRNKGILYSQAELIATLDHDDIWSDVDKIKKQLTALQADKNIALVGSQYYDIDSNGNILHAVQLPLTDAEIRKRINIVMPSVQSSFVFQKKVLDRVGGFNPNVSMTDDYEILYKVLNVGKMQNIADYTTKYRIHNNTSVKLGNSVTMKKDSLKVMLKYGNQYPNFAKAVLYKVFVAMPYGVIRPYISHNVAAKAKALRDSLLGNPNQLYTHTNYQDEA